MDKIKIDVTGAFTVVRPANLSILDRPLTYARRSFEFSKQLRKRVITSTDVALYTYDADNDAILVPTGLLDRVLYCLKKHGLEYDLTKPTCTNQLVRTLDLKKANLKGLRPEQKQIMSAVLGNSHSTVQAPTGAGKSFLIGEICKMYPHARILVTTNSVDVIETIKTYLETSLTEKIGQIGGGKNAPQRITVCTIQSLEKILVPYDIVIIDECHVVGSENYMKACLVASNSAFKVIGLSATPQSRQDNADLAVEAVCGPLRVKINYETSVQNGSVVPLQVEVYECPYGPSTSVTKDLKLQTDKDRVAIWNNKLRNKLIAEVVRKYMAEEPDTQILVYTERVEHALWLKSLLPEFTLVSGNITPERQLDLKQAGLSMDGICDDKKREEIKQRFATKELKYAICTAVWQKGVNFPHLEILVRADANSGEITTVQSSGRLSRLDEGKTLGRVIDFCDKFNNTYLFRFKERLKQYNEHGWKVVNKTYVRPKTESTQTAIEEETS